MRVGDVVKIYARESFPADLLLLRASDPPGQCWVNTKPLDGESDTKLRLAPRQTVARLCGPNNEVPMPAQMRKAVQGVVNMEAANDKVNDFM